MSISTNVDVNLYMDVTTIECEARLRSYCSEMIMLVEMCACSTPGSNTIRVVPVYQPEGDVPTRLETRTRLFPER